jgi:hypothetical protein
MGVVTMVKWVGALAGGWLILWLMFKQYGAPLGARLAYALLGILVLLLVFALVVSARCDMGWLPADEC